MSAHAKLVWWEILLSPEPAASAQASVSPTQTALSLLLASTTRAAVLATRPSLLAAEERSACPHQTTRRCAVAQLRQEEILLSNASNLNAKLQTIAPTPRLALKENASILAHCTMLVDPVPCAWLPTMLQFAPVKQDIPETHIWDVCLCSTALVTSSALVELDAPMEFALVSLFLS